MQRPRACFVAMGDRRGVCERREAGEGGTGYGLRTKNSNQKGVRRRIPCGCRNRVGTRRAMMDIECVGEW